MDIQQRKEEYLKKKYSEIASSILELISTPEKIQQEIKSHCYGLWRIYHHLDLELDYINTILETENGTKERYRRPRCDSCDEDRISSPTF